MSVVKLHQERPMTDVAATLRQIASDIESGEVEGPITTAVLLLGHRGKDTPDDSGGYWEDVRWTTYGFGPRADSFSVRGLMATALNRWGFE
jgi:hypothetical protein